MPAKAGDVPTQPDGPSTRLHRRLLVCESCRHQPATVVVDLDGETSFTVCGACADVVEGWSSPSTTTTGPADGVHRNAVRDSRAATAPATDDVPSLDWTGTLRVRQPWTVVAQPVGLLLAVGVLCAAMYLLGGRTNEAAMAMVAVGCIAAPAVGLLDRWLLRRTPAGCPCWKVHRRT